MFKKCDVISEKKMKLIKKTSVENGQGLTEYAVILSLVAVASIAGMAFFGGAIKGKLAALSAAVSGQSKSEITAADNKSKSAAKSAAKKAGKLRGNTTIDDEDSFDTQTL